MRERLSFERELLELDIDSSRDVTREKEPSPTVAAKSQQKDVVDDYLFSRRSLYKVRLVGTNVNVSLHSSELTEQYTSRALTEGAVGAVFNTAYTGAITLDQMRNAYEKVAGRGVKYTFGGRRNDSTNPVHWSILREDAMTIIAKALNLSPKDMTEKWRWQYNQAKMIEFAINYAMTSFASLENSFSKAQLAAGKIDVATIRYLLEKKHQSLIEAAKTHSSTKKWREAYKRNRPVQLGERPAELKDFDPAPIAEWAKTIAELAIATRNLLRKQIAHQIEQERKSRLNQHLMPHEIRVDDAAQFIAETFEPTHSERLIPLGSVIQGGQRLTNIKNEPIFLLRVESARVVYQHLGNRKFYEQSLEGFSQEQLYSVYAAAGEKAKGAIALSRWVLSLAGAVFPVVGWGLLATDVINTAFRLKENRPELERSYDAFKVAYRNIDALLPGVIPSVWDAVLDKDAAMLLNPLKHPDAGAWVKALIRLARLGLLRHRLAQLAKMDKMMEVRVKGIWAAIKKGADALGDVVTLVTSLATPIVGSTGVSGHRALELAQQKLKGLGVADAASIVARVKQLPKSDQERLTRELQDLAVNGKSLLDLLGKCLSW